MGTVHWALLDFVSDHVGQPSHPAGLDLVAVRRPLYRDQYLVAALVPLGYGPAHDTTECAVPFGIAVPSDPARAAAAVTRRLLPSYQAALRTVGHRTGWSALTDSPVNRAVAATCRSHHDTAVIASPPISAPAPLNTAARPART